MIFADYSMMLIKMRVGSNFDLLKVVANEIIAIFLSPIEENKL